MYYAFALLDVDTKNECKSESEQEPKEPPKARINQEPPRQGKFHFPAAESKRWRWMDRAVI
jgi:hypothetical protein